MKIPISQQRRRRQITTQHYLMLKEVEEVAQHYNSNNRALSAKGNCIYQKTDVSEGCAIGRKLTPDEKRCIGFFAGSIASLCSNYIVPSYWGRFSITFLMRLQDLHDTAVYWSDKGLNEQGQKQVDDIKIRILKGFYDQQPVSQKYA